MKISLRKKFLKIFYIKLIYSIIYFFLKISIIIFIISLCIFNSNEKLIMCNNKNNINSLINISRVNYKTIIFKEKEYLLNHISRCNKRKVTQINFIFLDFSCRFGNQLILLNKAIFYCEILKCKKIILNRNYYWFIKNKILYRKYKMSIEINKEDKFYYNNIIIDKSKSFFWFFKYFYPQYRTYILKKEILRNIPNIKINPNDIILIFSL